MPSPARKINLLEVDTSIPDDPGISVEHEDSPDHLLQYLINPQDIAPDSADIRQVMSASKAQQKLTKKPPP